jgi:hypothetical protein
LQHKSAKRLLRFRTTEYNENGVDYAHAWALKAISLSMLRAGKPTCAVGSITVSIFRVAEISLLNDGNNYEIFSYVSKKAEWDSPSVTGDDFQDKRLTLYTTHQTKVPEPISRHAHKAANLAIQYAMGHEYTTSGEALAKFVVNYRAKGMLSRILGAPM